VILSRDWHPALTTHFKEQGGPWPAHCVQGTPGADFHPDLTVPSGAIVVSKGMGSDEDGYSAFVGRDERGRRLADLLRELGATRIVVGGLATDYCVVNTALEGRAAGFEVDVIEAGIRAVDPCLELKISSGVLLLLCSIWDSKLPGEWGMRPGTIPSRHLKPQQARC